MKAIFCQSAYQKQIGDTIPAEKASDLSRLLQEYIFKKKVRKTTLARNAGMSDVYIHQLLSGARKPSWERLIRICITLHLTLDETQRLLHIACLPVLDQNQKRDKIIINGINIQMDLNQINDELFNAKEKLIM